MPRTQATTLTLPPFGGATRTLVLLNVCVFLGVALLHWVAPEITATVMAHLILVPAAVFRGEVWQLATYSVLETSLLGILFGMLTLWFAGSLLEESRSRRWVSELYWVSVAGGALLACLVAATHVFGLRTDIFATGAWSGIFGLLVAIAVLMGDREFLLWFVLRLKAKYMVAIYLLLAVAVLLKEGNAFSALLQLTGALAGYLYVRYAPRAGLAGGVSKAWEATRTEFYRRKRRRAARKFAVYMRKQNREVHFDAEGRYMDPDDARRESRSGENGSGGADSSSRNKRWMN